MSTVLFPYTTRIAGLPAQPSAKDRLDIRCFDLLTETLKIDLEQRIVTLVRGTADPVLNHDHAVAEIDCIEDGGQHADVSFGTGNDKAVRLTLWRCANSAESAKAE